MAALVPIVLMAALTVLLMGCSLSFTHPTKSTAEFEADLYDCEVKADAARNAVQTDQMLRSCMRVRGWTEGGYTFP